jgi:predicted flap endonuclease-1-like 5' DNA nuclease
MPWATEFPGFSDPTALRRQTERALSVPLGMANPFWLMFGAAAATGAAWWWMARLTRQAGLMAATDAANVYEMAEATAATAPLEISRRKTASTKAVRKAPAEAHVGAEGMHEDAEAAGYPPDVLEAQVSEAADDLTRLVGVGPRIAAALAARGVTRFAHLAAWGEAELETFDRDLKLRGRALRSDWVDQAKRLAAE